MVGMSAVLNDGPPSAAMVQTEMGTCCRMPVQTFRDEMDRDGPFSRLMTRYVHALVGIRARRSKLIAFAKAAGFRHVAFRHGSMPTGTNPTTARFLRLLRLRLTQTESCRARHYGSVPFSSLYMRRRTTSLCAANAYSFAY